MWLLEWLKEHPDIVIRDFTIDNIEGPYSNLSDMGTDTRPGIYYLVLLAGPANVKFRIYDDGTVVMGIA